METLSENFVGSLAVASSRLTSVTPIFSGWYHVLAVRLNHSTHNTLTHPLIDSGASI